MEQANRKLNVYICCSDQDETYKKQFITPIAIRGLNVLEKSHNTNLVDKIKKSDISILLISEEFINSTLSDRVEYDLLLQRNKEGNLRLYPILVKPCPSIEYVKELGEIHRTVNSKPIFDDNDVDVARELALISDRIFQIASDLLEDSRYDSGPAMNLQHKELLPFTNRSKILENLSPHQSEQEDGVFLFRNYVLIDGPAGRGKTSLLSTLKSIYSEYKNEKWACIDVPVVKTGNGLFDLKKTIDNIANSLKLDNWNPKAHERNANLGGLLYNKYEQKLKSSLHDRPSGLVFFIDFDHSEPSEDDLRNLFDFADRVYDKFMESGLFPKKLKERRLRFFIAGRYLHANAMGLSNSRILKIIHLLPFAYHDVEKTLLKYLVDEDEDTRKVKLLSPNVLYWSGGHPGLMAKIVRQYEQRMELDGLSVEGFITEYEERYWHSDLEEMIAEITITDGLFQRNHQLLEVSNALCAYRYFNSAILNKILDSMSFTEEEKVKIQSQIQSSGFYKREQPYKWLYHDGVFSTLLSRYMIAASPQKFINLCNQVKQMCVAEIQSTPTTRVDLWFFEYIHASLMQHAVQFNRRVPANKQSSQFSFFNIDLSKLKSILWHILKEEKKIEDFWDMIEGEFSKMTLVRPISNFESDTLPIFENDLFHKCLPFLANYVFGENGSEYDEKYFESKFINNVMSFMRRPPHSTDDTISNA